MITPTKGIAPDRALLTVGAQVVKQLDRPRTVSQTWSRLRSWRETEGYHAPISFGWFVLALDVLYTLGVLDLCDDLLVIRRPDAPAA
ncbi:ABC-three component system middle component 6 [Yinghuangia sp. YIM S10712]|uniref:ABC-three component system middle component 6 n=1 Tax=Yinghuangia sp. YIM S10712 TaxID=3436930 RepID=UPI003F52AF72